MREGITEFIAHVREDEKGWHIHDLEEHLLKTARLSGKYATKFGAENIGYLIGLWHDLGKYKPDFQNKIKSKSGYDPDAHIEGNLRVEHAVTGAIFATMNYQTKIISQENSFTLGHLVGIPILAHHAGLRNYLEDVQPKISNTEHEELILNEIIKIIPEKISHKPDIKSLSPTLRFDNKTIFIKMLYSCLVDADFLDTEKFMDQEKSKLRNSDSLSSISVLNERLNLYLHNMMDKSQKSLVNIERQKLLSEVEKK